MRKKSVRRGQAKRPVEFDPMAMPPEEAESSATTDQVVPMPGPGRPISEAEYKLLKKLASKPP